MPAPICFRSAAPTPLTSASDVSTGVQSLQRERLPTPCQQRDGDVDVAHLTCVPPFARGSFTKIIANIMRRMTSCRHMAISQWDQPLPADRDALNQVVLISRQELPLWKKAILHLPCRVRSRLFGGIGGRNMLVYSWRTIDVLRRTKPKILICYDMPWLGRILRRHVDWSCRIILSQHGLSYFQDADRAAITYSLGSFDSIWSLTKASYRYDRDRMSFYEPIVRVLPNPVDTNNFRPVSQREQRRLRAAKGLPQDRPIVLFLSVLRPKKGAHILLQSWAEIVKRVPEAFLWIVGGGESSYVEYLQRMTDSLGLSGGVRFEGAVHENVASCYQAADMFAFPTLFVEGQALSLIEAMSSGLACIASSHRVALEAYSEDEVMFVPDPNLEDAFVEPVVSLLRDTELRQRMGIAARAHAVQHNSYEVVLPLLERAFTRELDLVHGK
jgi:glycosyltransferase involved in cell wall biosynthesis